LKHLNFLHIGHAAPALNHIDPQTFEAADEAFALLGDDLVGVVGDAGAIEGHAPHLNSKGAEVFGILEFSDLAGGGEEGFGGDAAAIDAGAAHDAPFNDGSLESAGDGMEGCPMAADACSNNYQIIVKCLRHAWDLKNQLHHSQPQGDMPATVGGKIDRLRPRLEPHPSPLLAKERERFSVGCNV
jgi:hypothetical protein